MLLPPNKENGGGGARATADEMSQWATVTNTRQEELRAHIPPRLLSLINMASCSYSTCMSKDRPSPSCKGARHLVLFPGFRACWSGPF